MPDNIRTQLVNRGRQIPEINEIIQAYQSAFSVDLFDEMYKGSSKQKVPYNDKRVLETGMYAAAAFFLERTAGLMPNCIGFYSSGVAPALLYAGVFSAQAYLERVVLFHVQNRRAYADAGERYRLVQVRLESAPDEDLEGFVASALEERHLQGSVFLKDIRHKHTILVAGEEAGVSTILTLARERFCSVAQRVPRLVRVPAAHLPIYDRQPIIALLEGVRFSPPRIRLLGAQGEEVPAGTSNQAMLRSLAIDAAMGLLNTGAVVRKAAMYADRIVVMGSSLGARVLRRTEIGGYPRAELAFDSHAGVDEPAQAHQDHRSLSA